MPNRFYGILAIASAGGNPVSRHFLLNKGYSEDLIDECLEKGYLIYLRNNDIGDAVYIITNRGREVRDK